MEIVIYGEPVPQGRAEQKPRSKVVPLWQHNHGGDDGHGHA